MLRNVDGGGGPLEVKTSMAERTPPMLKTSMACPLGVLMTGPAAATTDVEDVDGGPPGGCWR
jgi:hypothetical protein